MPHVAGILPLGGPHHSIKCVPLDKANAAIQSHCVDVGFGDSQRQLVKPASRQIGNGGFKHESTYSQAAKPLGNAHLGNVAYISSYA